MKLWTLHLSKAVTLIGLAIFITGCAKTTISKRKQLETGKLPKPATIWVYDFAATIDDLPAESALAEEAPARAPLQTASHIEHGRQLGKLLAGTLAENIQAMGLRANRAKPESAPKTNDLVIRGYLVSFEEGDAVKRVAIGY